MEPCDYICNYTSHHIGIRLKYYSVSSRSPPVFVKHYVFAHQVVAEYEGTLNAVKVESRQLESRRKELEREHETLIVERQKIRQVQRSMHLEEQRLNDLALEVRQRSQDAELMCKVSMHLHVNSRA